LERERECGEEDCGAASRVAPLLSGRSRESHPGV
jgi:hypothetical protein